VNTIVALGMTLAQWVSLAMVVLGAGVYVGRRLAPRAC